MRIATLDGPYEVSIRLKGKNPEGDEVEYRLDFGLALEVDLESDSGAQWGHLGWGDASRPIDLGLDPSFDLKLRHIGKEEGKQSWMTVTEVDSSSKYTVTWVMKPGVRSPVDSGQMMGYAQAVDLYDWLMKADITEEISLWYQGRLVAKYDEQYWTPQGDPRV